MMKRSKTILIIEPDLSLRFVLRMAMDFEGHQVIEADSESMAQKIIHNSKSQVDCILHSISSRQGEHDNKFGKVPVILAPVGLLNLHDLNNAIRQAC